MSSSLVNLAVGITVYGLTSPLIGLLGISQYNINKVHDCFCKNITNKDCDYYLSQTFAKGVTISNFEDVCGDLQLKTKTNSFIFLLTIIIFLGGICLIFSNIIDKRKCCKKLDYQKVDSLDP